MTTPWIKGLKLPKCDKKLMALIRVPARAVSNLGELPIDTATKMLEIALSEVHRPSPQGVRAIRQIAGLAQAHALTHYANEAQFVRGAKCRNPLPDEPTIAMLTGPAGAGKSEIYKALVRLFLAERKVQVCDDLPEFSIKPIVSAVIGPNIRHVDVMNEIADSLGLEASCWDTSRDRVKGATREGSTYARANRESIRHAKLRLYQHGACCLLVDELQFLTRSREANALLAKLIAFFAVFGLPVVYICNYSAGHRLKMRPQEDRTRLLHNPIIILPDPPDEPSYVELLEDYLVVFDGTLDIVPTRDALEIHAMTFGLKRSARRLLVTGYRIARKRAGKKAGQVRVGMADLRQAYMSVSYEDDRKTVEACQAILMGIDAKREDLVCPFDLPPSLVEVQKKLVENVVQRSHSDAMLAATMTVQERKVATELDKKRDSGRGQVAAPVKAERKKRAPVTPEDLLRSELF